MSDARQALHGVGMIVCNKNGQTAYPDKGKFYINSKWIQYNLNLLFFLRLQ